MPAFRSESVQLRQLQQRRRFARKFALQPENSTHVSFPRYIVASRMVHSQYSCASCSSAAVSPGSSPCSQKIAHTSAARATSLHPEWFTVSTAVPAAASAAVVPPGSSPCSTYDTDGIYTALVLCYDSGRTCSQCDCGPPIWILDLCSSPLGIKRCTRSFFCRPATWA